MSYLLYKFLQVVGVPIAPNQFSDIPKAEANATLIRRLPCSRSSNFSPLMRMEINHSFGLPSKPMEEIFVPSFQQT